MDLQAIEAIKQLKYKYMRCVDRKLWKELEECFVPAATCSYGDGKYSFEGVPAIMEFLVGSMDRPSFLSSHRVHHPEITITSETTATGVWALEDYVIDTEHDITIQGAAFYTDRYVKVDGSWKIEHTGYERTFEQMKSRKEDPAWTITARGFGATVD